MKTIKDDTGLWEVWKLMIEATPRNTPIVGINPKTIEAMRQEDLIRDSDTDVYFADCAYETYRIIENAIHNKVIPIEIGYDIPSPLARYFKCFFSGAPFELKKKTTAVDRGEKGWASEGSFIIGH